MRKLIYGLAFERFGEVELLPLTFRSAREAQEWLDYQRTARGDERRMTIVRVTATQARP